MSSSSSSSSWRKPASGISSAIAIAVLLGCSPIIRVEARFELPTEIQKGADPTRLHVRGRVACHSFNLGDPQPKPPTAPPPGLEEKPTPDVIEELIEASTGLEGGIADLKSEDNKKQELDGGPYQPQMRSGSKEHVVGFTRGEGGGEAWLVRTQFRSSSCHLALSAFYDTNGDGLVGSGDYVGGVPSTVVSDRGLCSGNMNKIGPVKLTLVP